MTIRITYDEAEPGTEASDAFEFALEAGAMTHASADKHYVRRYTYVGDDGDPKRNRHPRNILFEHENGRATLRVPLPDLTEPEPQGEVPSYITSGHLRALQAVQQHPGVTLTSVRVNGDPGVAVVLVDNINGGLRVMPLFVAITEGMEIDYLEFDYHERGGKSQNGPRDKRPFSAVEEVTRRRSKVA